MSSCIMFPYPLSWFSVFWLITNSAAREEDGEIIERWHPMLPAEKKLVMYSLIIAVLLLLLLVWASYTFFQIGSRS